MTETATGAMLRNDAYPGKVRERVAAGVRLLNERRPGWALEIDTATLDLARPEHCVLGQLWGEYGTGTRALGLVVWAGGEPDEEASTELEARYGFEAGGLRTRARQALQYRYLTAAWREVIESQQREA